MSEPRVGTIWRILALAGLIATTGIFHIQTLRPGHNWGDDFGIYIQLAKNLAEGKSYAQTGYIYNPDFPTLGPAVYPPVYPLLLAPICKICGMNLNPMKVQIVVFFLLFLIVFNEWAQDRVGFPISLIATCLVAFNPAFWDAKDNILSDMPFLFLAFASLFLYERWRKSNQLDQLPYALAIGVIAYLAYGTRSVGGVLIAVFWVYEWIQFRKISRGLAISTGAFCALAAIQWWKLGGAGGYFQMWPYINPFNMKKQFWDSICEMLQFIGDNGAHVRLWGLLVMIGVCSLAGYVSCFRAGPSTFEVFPILYVPLIEAWKPAGWQDYRHLMPVFPLFILYAFLGLERILPSVFKRRLAIAVLALALSLSYISKYAVADYGPIGEGIENPASLALFDYVRNKTNPDNVFIFSKPRALALYTGRQAAAYAWNRSDDEMWRYFESIRANYVIYGRPFDNDETFLQPFLQRQSRSFVKTYSNRDFDVYCIVPSRIKGPSCKPA